MSGLEDRGSLPLSLSGTTQRPDTWLAAPSSRAGAPRSER